MIVNQKSAGIAGATGVRTSAPTVAGVIPPKFRSSLVESSLADAEFLRLPPPRGRCRISGMSRTALIEAGERGLFKLIRIRKPGATRGIILLEKSSLLAWLRSLTPEGDRK